LNNKSKINTSKVKMYMTVVAMASLLVMAFNLNSNMNSSMNAYASIFSNIQNADDIGQSLECVIVVVGCDGTGSVGSSGDVNVGSNNGNDDNNTNGGGDTPLPPISPAVCEECLGQLTTNQLQILAVQLGLEFDASLAEICLAIDALGTVEALVIVLDTAELTITQIVAFLTCLGIEISATEVAAILS